MDVLLAYIGALCAQNHLLDRNPYGMVQRTSFQASYLLDDFYRGIEETLSSPFLESAKRRPLTSCPESLLAPLISPVGNGVVNSIFITLAIARQVSWILGFTLTGPMKLLAKLLPPLSAIFSQYFRSSTYRSSAFGGERPSHQQQLLHNVDNSPSPSIIHKS
jgi:hypothetical protein